MINQTFKFFLYLHILFFLTTNLFSNTRVAFSRPGSLIRTPTYFDSNPISKYFFGVASETINTDTNNLAQSLYFHAISPDGLSYGIAYSTHAQINNLETPRSEISLHVNRKIYESNQMQIVGGIQDVLFKSEDEHELSLFISLVNRGVFLGSEKKYFLKSGVGFGSGKINNDSHNYNDEILQKARVFFGFKLKTPLLQHAGGLDLLLDYDGVGSHFGAKIPVNKNIMFNFALTNLQQLGNLNKYKEPLSELIFSDSPAISLGLSFMIPSQAESTAKIEQANIPFETADEQCIITQTKELSNAPLSLDKECQDQALNQFVKNINKDFTALNDSIKTINQEIEVYQTQLLENNYQINVLQDSINMQYLKHRISESELNIAMKHLSQSLQYFYLEDYLSALNQVEKVITMFPSLAIAYARKGTIYYKMGDIQNATINWNLALKYDPEYTEVQNMLLNIKQGFENN
mgnify:FL=1